MSRRVSSLIMALTKDQKQAQVKDLKEKMSSASSIILAHYIGLSVGEVSDLRSQLRECEAEMKVAKKTLMKIASKEAGLPEFTEESMEGPVSLILSYGDALSGAQTAFKFSKDHDQVQILGGLYDGKILTKEEAIELAKMPSRDVLLATFVGMIRSPLVSFAGMCNSPLSGFARALSELADKGGLNPPNQASDDAGSGQAEAEPSPDEVEAAPDKKDAEDGKEESGQEESQDDKNSKSDASTS